VVGGGSSLLSLPLRCPLSEPLGPWSFVSIIYPVPLKKRNWEGEGGGGG
jgi:hypothetical protein